MADFSLLYDLRPLLVVSEQSKHGMSKEQVPLLKKKAKLMLSEEKIILLRVQNAV